MYFVMSRLDAAKFCKLDFIVNFGVPPNVKTQIAELIQNGGGKNQVFKMFESLDMIVILKLHKYFFWADKKLHAVFFIEDKDEISEDLLFDFKDEEDDVKVRFK
jgi:hypothetical protein